MAVTITVSGPAMRGDDRKIRVRLYAWGGCKDIYLEVKVGKKNSIKFIHQGLTKQERQLTLGEARAIVEMLSRIDLNFLNQTSNKTELILPTIPTSLEIKSDQLLATFVWTNSDVATNKTSYQALESLSSYIEELMPINTDGLDMPVYL
jgi:hypothetical protein